MKRKILCSVLLLSILTTSHAQFGNLLKKKKTSDESEQTSSKKEEAVDAPEDKSPSKSQAWNIGFDREINWFNLTSLGSIIVSTD